MIIKLVFFILICDILWTGSFNHARPPQICPGPQRYKTPSRHDVYVQELERRRFINERGEFNKRKIDEIFNFDSTNAEEGSKIINGYKQCADEGMGEQMKENKYEAYLKCLNRNKNAELLFERKS